MAAALVHDALITPFGHLMEEAFFYSQASYHHESKLSVLLERRAGEELGGGDLQLYLGFQSGLREWAGRFFGVDGESVIEEIARGIQGKGRFGAGIAGELDLDNLDNVTRAAFHIGLPVDRKLPLHIAQCVEDIREDGAVFSSDAVDAISKWLLLREQVYSRFMLPRVDFSGKLMLLFAMVQGLKSDLLTEASWNLTDGQLLDVLLKSEQEDISSSVRRWLVGDVWDISELVWFEGDPPPFPSLSSYAVQLSSELSRRCFAYRIKDKRQRRVELHLTSGQEVLLGKNPSQWLLGVGSPTKKPFTAKENRIVIELAGEHFNAAPLFVGKHSTSLFS